MQKNSVIKGFSKLNRDEKIRLLMEYLKPSDQVEINLNRYLHPTDQSLFDDISENTVSNYYLPFSLAPNFLVNDQMYIVPMVIEESSVVAAASKAASFWAKNGGFQVRVKDTIKNGQLFFQWNGPVSLLQEHSNQIENIIEKASSEATINMRARGGGITGFEIKPIDNMNNTYQLLVKFKTANSMGANFINTCLELISTPLMDFINTTPALNKFGQAEHIMSILSNYTPECVVECKVECSIEQLAPYSGTFSPQEFAKRFKTGVDIAINDPYRAVTHNKGIFNGIDAVVLATGNDFRAVEAGAQAFAARSGQYRSLTHCKIDENTFTYTLEVPLALGTVGGLTNIHPMVKNAFEILGNPGAEELMRIVAAAGMANNFGAVTSLVTTGIQKGHMKLHLGNILTALNATEEQKTKALAFFADQTVSYSAVQTFLEETKQKA
ncbi:hydroxymethylglutaryl-CoA reductase [Carboxylicivirga caseinilyticus]|uniref:hydroxymethylglutaryl-CoA reductase n=1 Tax=Carboxylicivirga caseinilyticus TaxID=3417572 RepID=UPI003D350FF1|nr:hydroxymethylglutaryl-CoA reductase [Marinilabiliaceae bacterium A049]